jgi:methyl-accepting chemotaxis protein
MLVANLVYQAIETEEKHPAEVAELRAAMAEQVTEVAELRAAMVEQVTAMAEQVIAMAEQVTKNKVGRLQRPN